MADSTDIDTQDEPLVSVRYTLDTGMLSRAASVLAGPPGMNPAYIFSGIILAVMVFVLVTDNATNNQVIFGVCAAILAAAFWVVGSKWQDLQLKKLRANGFGSLRSKDETKRSLEILGDVIVSCDETGKETRYLRSDVKKALSDRQVCVVQMTDKSFLIIPHEAMTDSRYANLIEYLGCKQR